MFNRNRNELVKQAAFGAFSKIYLKIYFLKKIDFYSTASAISVQRQQISLLLVMKSQPAPGSQLQVREPGAANLELAALHLLVT